ncbi:nuclear pore complex protein Nup93-like [Haliotis rubra]|uniref:nuclear pore complex protein Nup93-like n=1 Tax=Haliotis rubra TaxID=36100 RepID=UPI001EE5D839|nr:nuclear pore complex protein Nup93-like [Haliotis rubra]XP_046568514.1 nuclear pore complex protein Nup93-like [Haliotis rubra]XP_046568515.1 nuclear pore complex protein Nup93-like [Haliotis rubra]
MEVEGFGDLLQQAEQLTADMDSGTDLPHVERNLHQILEAGQRLLTKTAPVSQDASDVKASILLGSKGYAVPKIAERLEGLKATTTFEPLEPVADTDIQGFLRNERENAFLAVIEQTRKHTFEEAERRQWECMENEWEREKQKILNTLLSSSQDGLELQQETESFIGDTIYTQGRSSLDHVEMAYARQVFMYNEQVIEGSIRPSLVDMFVEVAKKIDDKSVCDLWDMVQCMVEVPLSLPVGTSPAAMRQDKRMQMAFLNKARQYLEQTYVKYINTMIYVNLQQAQLGGVPGTLNLVKSYLKVRPPVTVRGSEEGLMDGLPVWALIYYCLRCGDLKAAQQVVEKASHQLDDFPGFFREYVNSSDHRLSPGSDTKIKLQYRRIVKNSTDSYKRAVYCVVGQCDFSEDHAEISDKIDDYLWLKLCQIQFEPDETGQEQFTLQKLQTLLYKDYGESHFNGYSQPFLYFQVLCLTAQFEAAIEFLSRIERLRCHAVHVALVLYELKLLALPVNCQAQLLSSHSSDTSPMMRLNLARLIMMYTRKFEATDAREALQYFYFLRDLRTSSDDNLFMSCVSELVLETREFEMLLGKLERDGTRKPGAIDKFNRDTQKIIELVAKDTESKGLFEDAVMLFDLAKNHEKTLTLLNKLLSQVISQPGAPQSNRDRLKNMALGIAQRYRTLGYEGTQATSNTFYLLLDLITFFDLYHVGSMDQGLEVVKQLKLLPLTAEEVEHRVNSFRHFTDEVRRCLPDILLAVMNILHNKYKNLRNAGIQSPTPGQRGRLDDGGKDTYLNYLRSQARALIMFAGMLPYRLPGDTNSRLVQIEVLMN